MMLIPTRRPIDDLRLAYKQKKRELKAARKAYRAERAKDTAYRSPNTSSEDEWSLRESNSKMNKPRLFDLHCLIFGVWDPKHWLKYERKLYL